MARLVFFPRGLFFLLLTHTVRFSAFFHFLFRFYDFFRSSETAYFGVYSRGLALPLFPPFLALFDVFVKSARLGGHVVPPVYSLPGTHSFPDFDCVIRLPYPHPLFFSFWRCVPLTFPFPTRMWLLSSPCLFLSVERFRCRTGFFPSGLRFLTGHNNGGWVSLFVTLDDRGEIPLSWISHVPCL